jgi:hypothetical protein
MNVKRPKKEAKIHESSKVYANDVSQFSEACPEPFGFRLRVRFPARFHFLSQGTSVKRRKVATIFTKVPRQFSFRYAIIVGLPVFCFFQKLFSRENAPLKS